MVWPTSRFGSPLPLLPVPGWCVKGEAACYMEVFCCPSVYPSAATARGVGGRGMVFTLPLWACALSVPGTGVVTSWEHGLQALSVRLVSILYVILRLYHKYFILYVSF